MEWLSVGVGALALLVLLAGRRGDAPAGRGGTGGSDRGPVAAADGGAAVVGTTAAVTVAGPGSVRETVLGRALDPDDPDGAFMDGYLAGRYTERHASAHGRDGPGAGSSGSARAADSEDGSEDDGSEGDGSVDAWDDGWEDSSGESSDVAWDRLSWSDPTAQDVAWESGGADDLDDW